MENKDKHPTEIIQNLDFEIHNLDNLIMQQSEDKIALDRLTSEIVHLESFIEALDIQLTIKRAKLNLLKERKQSLLNYLNDEN